MPSQLQIKKKIKNKDIMIGLHDMQTNHIFLIFLQIKYECTLQVIRYGIPVGPCRTTLFVSKVTACKRHETNVVHAA